MSRAFVQQRRRPLKQAGLAAAKHIRTGDWGSLRVLLKKMALKLLSGMSLPAGLFFALIIRGIRPWFLVRIGALVSERLGHLAANTELYLCERNASINTPKIPYVDLWYHNWPICNQQLARMWKRVLHVGPSWLLASVDKMNRIIPGGGEYRIGQNTQSYRDVHNLLDRFPAHLSFLPEEETKGEAGLRALGIPVGAPFVCLNVRDSSYLDKWLPWRDWTYHDYRNCNIQNYVLAAKELTNRGYYVIRMGMVVKEAINVVHPMIIDYAASGLRSDFMDIYLGANCKFCISNSTGFDAVPMIFRRPIVFVDHVPLGLISTWSSRHLITTKKHWLQNEARFMTIREIFDFYADAISDKCEDMWSEMKIDLLESSPDEIAAVVLEMDERLQGTWQMAEEDEELQRRFWKVFQKRYEWHGEIRSKIGADFLRSNKALLA